MSTIYWKDFFVNCVHDEFGEGSAPGQDLDGLAWAFGVSLSNSMNQSDLFEGCDLDFFILFLKSSG